MISHILNYEL